LLSLRIDEAFRTWLLEETDVREVWQNWSPNRSLPLRLQSMWRDP
jgi:uncharacterized membrane protein YbaN (DUF454 family)